MSKDIVPNNDDLELPIGDIEKHIMELAEQSRSRAFKKVNEELVKLYLDIGKYLSESAGLYNWGDQYIEGVANSIQMNYPGVKGFEKRNLERMRRFYELYADDEIASALLTQLSWTNNYMIVSRCKTQEERLFYINLAINENYSSRELERQLDSAYYERAMISKKKFEPVPIPEGIRNRFLDSYVLEFLDLPNEYSEKDLQNALISNIRDFILELGKDFTFVSQNYHLMVGDHNYYLDLLFYHRGLSCLVNIDLKIGEFKPEYLGKMGLYLEALDRDVRKPNENPSVGIILCADKDDEVVEYTMNRSMSPPLVAEYKLKLPDKAILESKLREYVSIAESKDE